MKVWTKNEILELIEKNDKMVCRSIAKLFEYQTIDEQNNNNTNQNNGIGFTGCDAYILSQFAKFYNSRGFLSPKQLVIGRKKLRKYSNQLAKIANGKITV